MHDSVALPPLVKVIDLTSPWSEFLGSRGLKQISEDFSSRYLFRFLDDGFSGFLHYMGNGLMNIKCTCTQHDKSEKCKGLWVKCPIKDADPVALLRSLIVWLSKRCSETDHAKWAYKCKQFWGMKPKALLF